MHAEAKATSRTPVSAGTRPEGPKPSSAAPILSLIGVVIFLLIGVMALVIYLKPTNFLRYGLMVDVKNLERQLDHEMRLPAEQFQELAIYLYSMKKFIEENSLNRDNLKRLAPVSRVFRAALKDHDVTRSELAAIRTAVWQSKIPLSVPGAPPRK